MSVSFDFSLKIWDLETGLTIRTLEGHSGLVHKVAVDGSRAVSVSEDRTLKVWDLDTGLTVASFCGDAPLLFCAIARNDLLVAADDTGRGYFLRLLEGC